MKAKAANSDSGHYRHENVQGKKSNQSYFLAGLDLGIPEEADRQGDYWENVNWYAR